MQRIALFVAGLIVSAAPCLAADGWTMKSEPPGCFASRMQESGGKVEIGVWPGRTVIGFSQPDLPADMRTVRVTLRIDDGPGIETDALIYNHAYAVTLRPSFAPALRSATHLDFVREGNTTRLDITNAGAAMDDAGRCAKLKTVPGVTPEPLKPLDDSPGWLVGKTLMGADVCVAHRYGPEAETIVYKASERGVLAVGLTRPDWMKPQGRFLVPVFTDTGFRAEAQVVGGYDVFIWKVSGDDLRALKKARTLTWQLPWGTFATDITGLDDADFNLGGCWTWHF